MIEIKKNAKPLNNNQLASLQVLDGILMALEALKKEGKGNWKMIAVEVPVSRVLYDNQQDKTSI